jgi:hypothetical protein
MRLSHFGMSLKNYITVKNKAHAFAPIHKNYFHFLIIVEFGDLPGFAVAIQISMLQDVILQHDDATPHIAHWTQELMQS